MDFMLPWKLSVPQEVRVSPTFRLTHPRQPFTRDSLSHATFPTRAQPCREGLRVVCLPPSPLIQSTFVKFFHVLDSGHHPGAPRGPALAIRTLKSMGQEG